MKPREIILTLAREVPLFSTEQAARLFMNNGSPSKRASELLTKLEKEKLLESRRREIGKTKLWRLSKIGREFLKVNRAPLAFTSQKVEHVLGIAEIFLSLFLSGRLRVFKYEPKDEFNAGKKMIYSPDAFFVLLPERVERGAGKEGGTFLLEYQKSPISSSVWAKKWAIAGAFFDGGFYKGASWQPPGNVKVKPRIVVISKQQKETITAGSVLPLLINESINFLIDVPKG